jgi:hypothetical protein
MIKPARTSPSHLSSLQAALSMPGEWFPPPPSSLWKTAIDGWMSGPRQTVHGDGMGMVNPRILAWEGMETFGEALECRERGECVTILGPIPEEEGQWEERWRLCNAIGSAWHMDSPDPARGWEAVLEAWIEPAWSCQPLWPLNAWVVRYWQRHRHLPLLPMTGTDGRRLPARWTTGEEAFGAAYRARWGEEGLMGLAGSLHARLSGSP